MLIIGETADGTDSRFPSTGKNHHTIMPTFSGLYLFNETLFRPKGLYKAP